MEQLLNTVKLEKDVITFKGSYHPKKLMHTIFGLMDLFKVDIEKVEMEDIEVSFTVQNDNLTFTPDLPKEKVPIFCALMLNIISQTVEAEYNGQD